VSRTKLIYPKNNVSDLVSISQFVSPSGTNLVLQLVVALVGGQHFKQGGAQLLWAGRDHVAAIQKLLHLSPKDGFVVPRAQSSSRAGPLLLAGPPLALLVVEEVEEVQTCAILLGAGAGQVLQRVQCVAVMREGDVASKSRASLGVGTGAHGLDEVLNSGFSELSHQAGHAGAGGFGCRRREGAEHLFDGPGLLCAHMVGVVEGLEQKDGSTFNGCLAVFGPHWKTKHSMFTPIGVMIGVISTDRGASNDLVGPWKTHTRACSLKQRVGIIQVF